MPKLDYFGVGLDSEIRENKVSPNLSMRTTLRSRHNKVRVWLFGRRFVLESRELEEVAWQSCAKLRQKLHKNATAKNKRM